MILGDESTNQKQELGGDNHGNMFQINGNGTKIYVQPEDIDKFERQNILNSTIEYILKENNFTFCFDEEINTPTSLEIKILVNEINPSLKECLISGRGKRYLIDELFEESQEFSIENLRKDVLKIYSRHYSNFTDMNKIIQKTYEDLFNKFEKRNSDLSISLFIIISYFFEICDIGDNPNDSSK